MGHGASTVVDPQAHDIEHYLEFASLKQTKITCVIDTHIQADHQSGGRALAARTGAAYGLHESADVAFRFTPLADGQELVCGNVTSQVLHTPGHTPESLSLVVTDRTRGPEPWFVLTGDTLFVGTVDARISRGRWSRARGISIGASSGSSRSRTTPSLPDPLLRLRLREGDERQAHVHGGVREAVQPGPRDRLRGRVRRHADGGAAAEAGGDGCHPPAEPGPV